MECGIFWDLCGINLDDTCVCCEQWCEKYKQGADSKGEGTSELTILSRGVILSGYLLELF